MISIRGKARGRGQAMDLEKSGLKIELSVGRSRRPRAKIVAQQTGALRADVLFRGQRKLANPNNEVGRGDHVNWSAIFSAHTFCIRPCSASIVKFGEEVVWPIVEDGLQKGSASKWGL